MLMRQRNSSRVFGSSLNTPNIVDVVVVAWSFCTPRITMHMCLEEKSPFPSPFSSLRRLYDDSNASWLNRLAKRLGDLFREAFLNCRIHRGFKKITPLPASHLSMSSVCYREI